MLSIDAEKCTGCGTCVSMCQNFVYKVDNGKSSIRDEEQCASCGQCVYSCPSKAISHERYDLDNAVELPGVKIDPGEMMNMILSRRSVRDYKEKAVDEDTIKKLIEAATNAGTSSNGETEGFVVISDKEFLKALERETVDTLWNAGIKFLDGGFMSKIMTGKYGEEMVRQYVRYNRIISKRREENAIEGMIFRNAPLVILSHGIKTNVNAPINCAIAMRNMEFMAQSMGLGTCWTGFVIGAADKQPKKYQQLLGIPPDQQVYGGLMIGYPKREIKYQIPRKERSVKFIA